MRGILSAVLPAALLLGLLAGCSSDGERERVNHAIAARLIPGVSQPATARYKALAAAGAPSMTARNEATGQGYLLRRLAVSPDGVVTWIAPDDTGFSFRDGVLVATRGVGNGVMSTDVSDLRALLRSGGEGTAKRFESTLDGNNRIVLHSYVCTITRGSQVKTPSQTSGQDNAALGGGGILLTEDCSGSSEGFVNRYRLSGSGQILQSVQYPRPGTGPFLFGPGAS